MPTLSEAVDALILELYRGSTRVPFPKFKGWALEQLGSVVRFDSAWWGKANSRPGKIVSVHLHNADPSIIDDYRLIEANDYFRDAMLARPSVTVNIGDLLPRKDFERTDVYTRYGRKHGIESAAGTVWVEPVTSMLEFLTVWRHDPRWPFSEADRLLLERLTPHLFESNRICLRLSLEAETRPLALRDAIRPWALASVDDDCFVDLDASFVALARREWPGWSSARVPDELRERFADCRTFTGRSLVVHVRAADERRLLVAQPRGSSVGLGPREAEVLRRYTDGMTYKEIARELGTSPATVRNQVARLLRRFGVHSKVELIRAAAADGLATVSRDGGGPGWPVPPPSLAQVLAEQRRPVSLEPAPPAAPGAAARTARTAPAARTVRTRA